MCHRLELRLPARAASVPSGRQIVADALDGWGVGTSDPAFLRRGDILLLTTELLANAVRVAKDPIVLCIEAHRDSIRVVVADDSPLPAVRQSVDDRSSTGRGLAIVDAVTDEWGQHEYDGTAKDVWGVVRIPTGSVLERGCRI